MSELLALHYSARFFELFSNSRQSSLASYSSGINGLDCLFAVGRYEGHTRGVRVNDNVRNLFLWTINAAEVPLNKAFCHATKLAKVIKFGLIERFIDVDRDDDVGTHFSTLLYRQVAGDSTVNHEMFAEDH